MKATNAWYGGYQALVSGLPRCGNRTTKKWYWDYQNAVVPPPPKKTLIPPTFTWTVLTSWCWGPYRRSYTWRRHRCWWGCGCSCQRRHRWCLRRSWHTCPPSPAVPRGERWRRPTWFSVNTRVWRRRRTARWGLWLVCMNWAHLPYDFLAKVSNEIINKVRGVNRVCYDISSKPPSTIEWEWF